MDKTLLKGLALLESVIEVGRSASIEEVAEQVGLSRSNAHRTLQTLMHAGYVERDLVNGGYRSTTKMFTMGVRQIGRLDVHRIAPQYLTRLAKETGETIHLAVLEGAEVVYIDKIDSRQAIGAYAAVGGRAPAHATATGKALLSVSGAESLRRLELPLKRFTSLTLKGPKALQADLDKAARAGYAVDRGEWREGVGGLGAAAFNGFDSPVAALGICGPLERLTPARLKQLAPILIEVAAQLSSALGHAPDCSGKPASA